MPNKGFASPVSFAGIQNVNAALESYRQATEAFINGYVPTYNDDDSDLYLKSGARAGVGFSPTASDHFTTKQYVDSNFTGGTHDHSGSGQGSTTLLPTQIRVGDGSAAAPSYSFSLDTDTGIYRPGSDQLSLSLGGVQKINLVPLTDGIRVVLPQSYDIYVENVGAGSANNRLWINAPSGGEMFLGPRAGGDLLFSLQIRSAVTQFVGEIQYVGSFSSSNRIIDLGQSYVIYSDNVGAGSHNTRIWLDGPNQGELVLGPRSGASYLYQIRYRATRHSLETDGNTLLITTSSMTFGGNTVWHAGNDGSGSGLDADTVDGMHASGFAVAGHDHSAGGTDGASILYASQYSFSGDTNTYIDNGAGDQIRFFRGGALKLTVDANGIYPVTITTTSSANLYQPSSGSYVARSTSTFAVKREIVPLGFAQLSSRVPREILGSSVPENFGSVLSIAPAFFKSNCEADDQERWRLGFIFEDVEDKFPLAVGNGDGVVEDRAILAALLWEVQKLRQEVNRLNALVMR